MCFVYKFSRVDSSITAKLTARVALQNLQRDFAP